MISDDCGEADWRRLVEKALAGAPFEQLVAVSEDGIAYGPVHAKAPVRPILRNPLVPWSIAQRLDDPDPDRARHQGLDDLDGGADSLVLVFRGAASAHGFGLAAEAIGTVLDGVMLDILHLRIEAGVHAGPAIDAVIGLAEARGLALGALDLDLCLDPLGPLALSGHLPADDRDLRETFGNRARDLLSRDFRGRLFEADGRLYHAAGASEAQELGAVLAAAVYALRIMEASGADLGDLVDRIGFTLAADQKQFLVTAKLRALRLLWQRVQMLCGIAAPSPARLHVETSMRMMAATDPHTNILRTTVAAFAAATGGADRIAVLPFTAANGLPEAKARRLARNTQLILRDETGLGRVGDPAVGAGGIEALTESLAAAGWEEFRRIEREGGLFASLRGGALQRRIGAVRTTRAEAVAERREPLVGVTLYPPAAPVDVALLPDQSLQNDVAGVPTAPPLHPIRLSQTLEAAR